MQKIQMLQKSYFTNIHYEIEWFYLCVDQHYNM